MFKNNKKILIYTGILVAIVLAGYFCFYVNNNGNNGDGKNYNPVNICQGQNCEKPAQIPNSVVNKQRELSSSQDIVAVPVWCKKGGSEIYRLTGGGGFVASYFYYDENGKEIASESRDDVVDLNEKYTVDFKGYSCTALTEGF
ncbi:MAG TPA: hypothetical protein VGC58_01605 [Candidatus Paceibacterota bacterium]